MLKTIIKREILEYLKSAKFLIGLGITLGPGGRQHGHQRPGLQGAPAGLPGRP